MNINDRFIRTSKSTNIESSPTMSENDETPTSEARRKQPPKVSQINNSKLKLWLDFGKWVFGTFALGIASMVISSDFKNTKLQLDEHYRQQQINIQIAKQEHDTKMQEFEQQRIFLQTFVNHAMSNDISTRIRIAHYVKSTATNMETISKWTIFYNELVFECQQMYEANAQRQQLNIQEYSESDPRCQIGGTSRTIESHIMLNDTNAFKDWIPKSPGNISLSEKAIDSISKKFAIDTATIRAFADVEASGFGFLVDGRPRILFESHWFHKLTDGKYDATNPNISTPTWVQNYRGGTAEYSRLEEATNLDKIAALQSTSWGLFQILGVHYKEAGYNTVEEFVHDQFESTEKQIEICFKFIVNKNLDDDLREHRWVDFVRSWNGPFSTQNNYAERLAEAYKRFSAQQ